MFILAHRGFWLKEQEQNSKIAFIRALDYGFGVELDVRDCCKEIVISHNIPDKRSCRFVEVLHALSKRQNFRNVTYAVNIKSDGIEKQIVDILSFFGIKKNSFVFDMSIPSTYIFWKEYYKKAQFACRLSDIENLPVFYDCAKWLWLDELDRYWISNNVIIKHVKNGKSVCMVSPELHGRQYRSKWKQYRQLPQEIAGKIYICTDFPAVANDFFNSRVKR